MLLRRLVDMLGICVCLCAVFTHVLSQEAEEPISYTVSEGFLLPALICGGQTQPDMSEVLCTCVPVLMENSRFMVLLYILYVVT